MSSSALAIVRASGNNSISLLAKVFSRPASLLKADGNSIVYGFVVAAEGDAVDEVLVSVFRSPKSYTGEDMVEVSCHGGAFSARAVLAALLSAGFREAEKGEFTLRAFLHGKTDLTRAEAVRELIDANTKYASSRALKRVKGELFRKINKIKGRLVEFLASLEAQVEYPEDENAVKDVCDFDDLYDISVELTKLEKSWSVEKLYQQGVSVVISGRVNAGKSSLFNAFLKEERAIVSDIEGTTRDYLECDVSLSGLPVRLFDTAGLRFSKNEVETIGIKKARDVIDKADARLYLIDLTKGAFEEDEKEVKKSECPTIIVWNKADLDGADSVKKSFNFAECVKGEARVSAKTGEGLKELYEKIETLFVGTEDSFSKEVSLGSDRQKECVKYAKKSVDHAILAIKEGMTGDAVMEDIEEAIEKLGECTGEVRAEDILENIFSRFCVGK